MMLRGVRAFLACVATAIGVSACGGGGGGSQPAPTPAPTPAPPTYTVGGTVSGLAGGGLVLRNNGGNDLAIAANGAFTFTQALGSGATYSVTVQAQPATPTQTCNVVSGGGTLTNNVANVTVTCITSSFNVGGTVSGLSGTGLVLRNNGGNDIAVSSNGTFTFTQPALSGAPYAVTVHAQPVAPAQTCSTTSGSGTVGGTAANVTITCVTNTYSVGGTITGLAGMGLVLRNNGGDSLAVAANGAFTFGSRVPSGGTYAVTVHTHPAGPVQTCVASNSSGNVVDSNVTSIAIECFTAKFTIGGTVTGLQGGGLILRNNGGDSLSITTDGEFTFPTLIDDNAAYDVATFAHPLNPDQECTVTHASGIVATASVTNVSVNCYVMGKWLYAVTDLTGTLAGFTIDQATGMLGAIPGMGGAGGPTPPPKRFLYFTNGDAATISGYNVNPASGALTAVPNSPFVGGQHPIELPVVSPNGKFLYSTDQTNPRFFGYRIDDATGELTPIAGSPFTTAAGTIYARIDPTGRFLYVVTRTLTPPVFDAIALSAYSIDSATGALTLVPGTPLPVGTSMPTPGGMELSSDGAALFILPAPQPPSVVYGYTLNATTGLPVPMPDSPFTLPNSAYHLRPHPRLPVLYIGGSNFVAAYGIGTTLTPLTGSPYAMTGAPFEIAFDPGARFLYAATPSAGIKSFDIKSDGALEAMINGEVVTGSAARLLADPGGRYLFMSNGFPGYIQPIAINTRTGRLTLVQGGLINSGNGTSLLTVVK